MENVRSLQSVQECYVSFENTTERTVTIIWIDYDAKEKFYMIVRPHAKAKVNTFLTHAWMFRDRETGEQMHYMHSTIFRPAVCYARLPRPPPNLTPVRQRAIIHFPLRTLRDSCLWQVLRSLRVTKIPVDFVVKKINTLDLPQVLKEDLRFLHKGIVKHKEKVLCAILTPY